MRAINRPSLPVLAISVLAHAGAVLLALSGVATHLHQRPEPAPLAVTLLPPPSPPSPAPVAMPAPVVAAAPEPKPEPTPKPAPRPRPVPVAKPKTAAPPPLARPQPAVREQETATQAPAVSTDVAPAAPPAPPAPPAPAPEPVRTGVAISASYAASNRPPVQPARSLRNGEQGKVILRVMVQADGSAGEVQVRTSSGFPLLDEAARSAVQTWRFNPATSDGKPIAEWYLVPIIFKLSN